MSNETQSPKNVESEYQELCSKNQWTLLYQKIRNESMNYNYTFNESRKPQNNILNRYRDVSPYDHTRIILNKEPCDYINANTLQVDKAQRKYILTQGPLPNTASHFWLMVWEQNSKAIIMLNKVVEKNQVKCHQYWPMENTKNQIMEFHDQDLKVEYISKRESSDYVVRTLGLTNQETGETREILHFHYTTWPDFGVPESPTAFLRFLADCRESGALGQNAGPAIVHCSAGIGRSGTFCLVDTCLVLIEKDGLNSVDVKQELLEMRKSRMGLIQTPDQLRFSYAAIIEGSKHLPLSTTTFGNNGFNNGHNDIVNNANDSSAEDDEAPPLPPPRGDSLVRNNSHTASNTHNDNEFVENINNHPLDKPLPQEPRNTEKPEITTNSNNVNPRNRQSTSESSNHGDDQCSPSSPDSNNELRRRRQEKKEKLDVQIQNMKRKQKQTEDWQNIKRSLFTPLSLGLGVLIGGGALALHYYWRN